jgi:hypothetical protein
LDNAWHQATEHLKTVNPLAKTYLVGTKPLSFTNGILVIGFDPEFAERLEFVDNTRNKEVLQTRLKELLHTGVTLKFELSAAVAPSPLEKKTAAEPVKAAGPAPGPRDRRGRRWNRRG